MSDSPIIATSDDNFENDILKAAKPTVVDFWAPWCGPCRAIAPTMELLAMEYEHVQFAKINIDDNPKTPGQFNVRAIPTLIFFKDGEVKETITGAVGKAQLEDALKKIL